MPYVKASEHQELLRDRSRLNWLNDTEAGLESWSSTGEPSSFGVSGDLENKRGFASYREAIDRAMARCRPD